MYLGIMCASTVVITLVYEKEPLEEKAEISTIKQDILCSMARNSFHDSGFMPSLI